MSQMRPSTVDPAQYPRLLTPQSMETPHVLFTALRLRQQISKKAMRLEGVSLEGVLIANL